MDQFDQNLYSQRYKAASFMDASVPMSSGFFQFMKEMIDNRITLLVRSEVKKHVKNQMSEVEIKLMKFI